MTRDDYLLALQRLIATEKGYTRLALTPGTNELSGWRHPDEGPTLVPRWPWDWCEAGELVADFCARPKGRLLIKQVADGYIAESFEVDADGYREMATVQQSGGETIAESCARCWLAWKGVDLSHLEVSRCSRTSHQRASG